MHGVVRWVCERWWLPTLDVSDAFLQVPQTIPRKISLDGCEYIILKCLPGQRDASRLWYAFFVERLKAHVPVEVCPEQPCILKCGNDGVQFLHVDDVLICGCEEWISSVLIPSLEKEFKLTYAMVKRQDGGSLEFLKRNHLIEPGYSSITITAEGKHASAMIERFSNIDGKLPRIAFTPTSGSLNLCDSDFLPPLRAAGYRSLVGIAMYLAQERFDLQYATKTLASCLQQPTRAAWSALGRLVGYLRFSEDFGLKMESKRGSTFMDVQMKQQTMKMKTTLSRSIAIQTGVEVVIWNQQAVLCMLWIVLLFIARVDRRNVCHCQAKKQSGMRHQLECVMLTICNILLSLWQVENATFSRCILTTVLFVCYHWSLELED